MTSHDEDFLTLLKEQEQGISEDFKDLIEGDVTVIAQDKIETKKKALDKDLAKVRQQAAVRKPEDITDSASSGFVQMVKPNDVLDYKKPGIQPFVIKKLRNG